MNKLKTKVCTKCNRSLGVDSFYSRGVKRGGTRSECKICIKKHSKKYHAEHGPFPSQTRGTLSCFKTVTWDRINNRTVNGKNPHYDSDSASRYIQNGIQVLELSANVAKGNEPNRRRYSKPVLAANGKKTLAFKSVSEAGRSGFKAPEIFHCLAGRRKSHYGYTWRYAT